MRRTRARLRQLRAVARTRRAARGRGRGAEHRDVILWPVTEQSGGPGSLILIVSEVSKRVRAEKLASAAFAAEKSRAAELESVINQMDEGVVIVDARGRYRVNPAGRKILGREPSEFRDGVEALNEDMGLRRVEGSALAPATRPSAGRSRRASSQGERLKIVEGAARSACCGGRHAARRRGGRRDGAARSPDIPTRSAHEELGAATTAARDDV